MCLIFFFLLESLKNKSDLETKINIYTFTKRKLKSQTTKGLTFKQCIKAQCDLSGHAWRVRAHDHLILDQRKEILQLSNKLCTQQSIQRNLAEVLNVIW